MMRISNKTIFSSVHMRILYMSRRFFENFLNKITWILVHGNARIFFSFLEYDSKSEYISLQQRSVKGRGFVLKTRTLAAWYDVHIKSVSMLLASNFFFLLVFRSMQCETNAFVW